MMRSKKVVKLKNLSCHLILTIYRALKLRFSQLSVSIFRLFCALFLLLGQAFSVPESTLWVCMCKLEKIYVYYYF